MVRKLIKHELVYYIRTLSIFWPWVLLMGVGARIVFAFYDESTIMRIAAFGAFLILALSVCALMLFSLAAGVVRFYKNMYAAEGYLTFSLPVTNVQHILVKLGVVMGVFLVSVLVSLLALSIAFFWEPFRAISVFFQLYFRGVSTVHGVLYVLEAVLAALICLANGYLLFYACISLGQRAKKNRILLSIGVYYIHNFLMEMLGMLSVIGFAFIAESGVFMKLLQWAEDNPYGAVHGLMGALLVWQCVLAALYFFVTLFTMNRKLNLE